MKEGEEEEKGGRREENVLKSMQEFLSPLYGHLGNWISIGL